MIGKIERVVNVKGYWLDSKETFTDYKCLIGAEYEEVIDDGLDLHIFFWFQNDEDFESYLEKNNKGKNEFVITEFEDEELPKSA